MDKIIHVAGRKVHFYCDEKCNKAFGLKTRPKAFNQFLSDDEIGEVSKEHQPCDKLGGWCITQCERCLMLGNGPLNVPDFNKRFQIN